MRKIRVIKNPIPETVKITHKILNLINNKIGIPNKSNEDMKTILMNLIVDSVTLGFTIILYLPHLIPIL